MLAKLVYNQAGICTPTSLLGEVVSGQPVNLGVRVLLENLKSTKTGVNILAAKMHHAPRPWLKMKQAACQRVVVAGWAK